MSGIIYGESGAAAPSGPTLRQRLKAGETAYGASCSLGSAFIAQIMVRAGLSGHPVEMRDAGFRLITMATDRSMIEAGVKDLKAKMALARG